MSSTIKKWKSDDGTILQARQSQSKNELKVNEININQQDCPEQTNQKQVAKTPVKENMFLENKQGMVENNPANQDNQKASQNQNVKSETDSWWMKFSKKPKIFHVITCIVLFLFAISAPVIAIPFLHLRDTFITTQLQTYPIKNQNRTMLVQSFNFSHFVWLSQNNQIDGQIITLPTPNQPKGTPAPGIAAIFNQQMGFTMKVLGPSNYVVEIDPDQLWSYYQNTYPNQTKRLLTNHQLIRNLQSKNQEEFQKQFAQKVILAVAEATGMDKTQMAIEADSSNPSDNGQWAIDSRKPSRLLSQSEQRRLLYLNILPYLLQQSQSSSSKTLNENIIQALKKMIEGLQEANKRSQSQTNIIVINLVNINNSNNTSVVINSNVVANTNQNRQLTSNPNDNIKNKQHNTNTASRLLQSQTFKQDQHTEVSLQAFLTALRYSQDQKRFKYLIGLSRILNLGKLNNETSSQHSEPSKNQTISANSNSN